MRDERIEAILWLSSQDCPEALSIRDEIRRLREENEWLKKQVRKGAS